ARATGRVDRCWRHQSGSRPRLGDIENPWYTPRRAFVPSLDTQAREDRSPPTMCRHGHMRAGDAMVFRIPSGTVGINACQRSEPMTQPPRIAALIADGFQEEECLVPRFALQLLGARVDMVSSTKAPVAIYSYFEKVGTYDVDYAIDAVDPRDF